MRYCMDFRQTFEIKGSKPRNIFYLFFQILNLVNDLLFLEASSQTVHFVIFLWRTKVFNRLNVTSKYNLKRRILKDHLNEFWSFEVCSEMVLESSLGRGVKIICYSRFSVYTKGNSKETWKTIFFHFERPLVPLNLSNMETTRQKYRNTVLAAF